MNVNALVLPALFAIMPLLLSAAAATEVRLRRIAENFRPGTAGAVVVEEGALVHTALMFPVDRDDRLVSQEAGAQTVAALRNLELALAAAGTDLDHLVRLHVYLADAEVGREIEEVLARRFRAPHRPALTMVESAMPREDLLVTMDAIAATAQEGRPGERKAIVAGDVPRSHPGASHASIQPEGPWVVVSGRAAPGEFEEGIRGTMERLRSDLEGVGLGLEQVVQVKGFLRDMSRMGEAEKIVAEFFAPKQAPPQVFAEWVQSALPAEIEGIAVAGPAGAAAGRLEFVEPGARFSRMAWVNGGRPVFISGLYGRSQEPREQVREIFAELTDLLASAGSDLRHLVKATYYVSDDEADGEINRIRPTRYEADRAPAASKLSVRGTGRKGMGSTLDMIAVTVE